MEEQTVKKTKKKEDEMPQEKVNPLRKEKVYVRFVPHGGFPQAENKSHVVWGAKADGSTDTLCVPVLRSTGAYKNVLTNEEKDYLEEALGLDYNALSVYRKENNYWDNYRVTLSKEGLYLDLSDPEQYIKYKVLLANSDIVAPSVTELQERPKATYSYVIVRDTEETSIENAKMDNTMKCYMEFGKIQNDFDTLRTLISLLDGRPYGVTSQPNFLKARANALIQQDAKKFLNGITDPMLHTKVIIRRATELGKLSMRGDYYYLKSDGTPLCDNGENPTLAIAAKYLNQPSHRDIKFLLESEVEKYKGQ